MIMLIWYFQGYPANKNQVTICTDDVNSKLGLMIKLEKLKL